jgi:hypothetical protein
MALNPLTFTEKVVGDFLKYQLTAYPFTDPGLNEQMRQLLSVEALRRTPLLKGPYISLSRAFRTGKSPEMRSRFIPPRLQPNGWTSATYAWVRLARYPTTPMWSIVGEIVGAEAEGT